MEKELKGLTVYKSQKDLTVEDISILKGSLERTIEKEVSEFENITGLKVHNIYFGLFPDDLGNNSVEISIKL